MSYWLNNVNIYILEYIIYVHSKQLVNIFLQDLRNTSIWKIILSYLVLIHIMVLKFLHQNSMKYFNVIYYAC